MTQESFVHNSYITIFAPKRRILRVLENNHNLNFTLILTQSNHITLEDWEYSTLVMDHFHGTFTFFLKRWKSLFTVNKWKSSTSLLFKM